MKVFQNFKAFVSGAAGAENEQAEAAAPDEVDEAEAGEKKSKQRRKKKNGSRKDDDAAADDVADDRGEDDSQEPALGASASVVGGGAAGENEAIRDRVRLAKYIQDTLLRLTSSESAPPSKATLREKVMPQVSRSILKMAENAPPGVRTQIVATLDDYQVTPHFKASLDMFASALEKCVDILQNAAPEDKSQKGAKVCVKNTFVERVITPTNSEVVGEKLSADKRAFTEHISEGGQKFIVPSTKEELKAGVKPAGGEVVREDKAARAALAFTQRSATTNSSALARALSHGSEGSLSNDGTVLKGILDEASGTAQKLRYCPQCNMTTTEEDALFCRRCGSKLQLVKDIRAPPGGASAAATQRQAPSVVVRNTFVEMVPGSDDEETNAIKVSNASRTVSDPTNTARFLNRTRLELEALKKPRQSDLDRPPGLQEGVEHQRDIDDSPSSRLEKLETYFGDLPYPGVDMMGLPGLGGIQIPPASVTFSDEDGDTILISMPSPGQSGLELHINGEKSRNVRELQLEYVVEQGCVRVYMQNSEERIGATMAVPPPGSQQIEVCRQMVALSRANNVPITNRGGMDWISMEPALADPHALFMGAHAGYAPFLPTMSPGDPGMVAAATAAVAGLMPAQPGLGMSGMAGWNVDAVAFEPQAAWKGAGEGAVVDGAGGDGEEGGVVVEGDQVPPITPSVPSFASEHLFHKEVATMGTVSDDYRKFTKTAYEGRLSIITESQVHTGGTHRFLVQFTSGEMSKADGVGFVFSSRLPCKKNIQRIVSIFVNQRGRVCGRICSELVRVSAHVKPLRIGDWIEMVVDLDNHYMHFAVWPAKLDAQGNQRPVSTAGFAFAGTMTQYRWEDGSQIQLHDLSMGHLGCIVKNVGVTVSLGS
eukprot:TRINITY_DN23120_c0_g1_i1.p1 TRINITY_DN23120_c0_g1~~TRINITY_DN23120_c0_g1_i1.p1  ORF type:complete len:882 (+),score=182.91 TRINITY_DN23120_c0_g1_i1:152-2797(+)